MFYAVAMYTGGLTQSLMWKQFTEFGTLQYPNFLETVIQIVPFWMIRAFGGTLYLTGVLVMVYNLMKTARQGKFEPTVEAAAAPLEADQHGGKVTRHRWLERRPLQFTAAGARADPHRRVGGRSSRRTSSRATFPTITSVKPYTPLELQGRDLYIREGCNNCHSQMVRPFRSETERYGEYSKAGEFVYDHPFLWGSKRTGPDLHRVGGKYPHLWHYLHMNEPTTMSPGSIMPPYPWLLTQDLDVGSTPGEDPGACSRWACPYPTGYDERAVEDLQATG